jgi:dTDP-4-dehydrorhamnose 3,5-epimerase
VNVITTNLRDCVVIEPNVFGDERGFFLETFQAQRYADIAGIALPFVQDNHSRSSKGVLRGLHFQMTKPQGKLVRVVRGEVYDVAVDIREGSKTYGLWHAEVLSEHNKRQFWVPPGFAHGFVVLSEIADFEYKCTDYYDPNDWLILKNEGFSSGQPRAVGTVSSRSVHSNELSSDLSLSR